jgi:hypothetical protein
MQYPAQSIYTHYNATRQKNCFEMEYGGNHSIIIGVLWFKNVNSIISKT